MSEEKEHRITLDFTWLLVALLVMMIFLPDCTNAVVKVVDCYKFGKCSQVEKPQPQGCQ